MSKDLWCPIPWVHTSIKNNGDLRLCCQANTAKNKGVLRNKNGEPFRADVPDDITNSKNSDLSSSVRKKFLENQWPEECIRCRREESVGAVSRRQHEVKRYTNKKQHLLDITDVNGRVNLAHLSQEYFDIRFGNLCNLKCRMCSPTESNMWYNDYSKLWNTNTFKDTHGTVTMSDDKKATVNLDYEWIHSEVFWQQLTEQTEIQYIQMAGGEPFIIPKHLEYLQTLIKLGKANQITLEYNTNLTVLPQKLLDAFAHFREVKLIVSIDGIKKQNEYIRNPSKWGKLISNIERLESNRSKINMQVYLSVTVQMYNIFYLPEIYTQLCKLIEQYDILHEKVRPFPISHPVTNPKFMNIKYMPRALKDICIDKLQKSSYRSEFVPYINQLRADDTVDAAIEKEFAKFLKATNVLDDLRGESFRKTFSEFAKLIKKHTRM